MSVRNRRSRQASIGVDLLEGRVVLSTVSTATIATLKGELTHGLNYLELQGTAHGTPTTVVGNPDVGTSVMLRGTGQLPGLGSVKISGALHGTGFIASSHVDGTLTITTHKGSVTLGLQSPAAGGFTAPKSGTYSFTIQKGTGSMAHDFGNGTVDIVLGSKSFTLTFHGKPSIY